MNANAKAWLTQLNDDGELCNIINSPEYRSVHSTRVKQLIDTAQRFQSRKLGANTISKIEELAYLEDVASFYKPHNDNRAYPPRKIPFIHYEKAREFITDVALEVFKDEARLRGVYFLVEPRINIYTGQTVLKINF